MTSYVFRSDPAQRHPVHKRGDQIFVDGSAVQVRALGDGHFVTKLGNRFAHVRVAADGDTLFLQLDHRGCVIERVDATRGGAGAASGADGGRVSSAAPMPGVVVNWIAEPGQTVIAGEPLLVIESMKLQMTIEAPQSGLLEELPFKPGQTFQRGAVLARVRAEGAEDAQNTAGEPTP
jgi:3-methylcrotonyl-CoA carboxylase alpha subunit